MKLRRIALASLLMTLANGFVPHETYAETVPTEPFQSARERVAQDSANHLEALSPVTITLRRAKEPQQPNQKPESPGWISWLGGKGTKIAPLEPPMEVVARLKNGEEAVIERFTVAEEASLPLIIDATGNTIGYFRLWSTKEGRWNFARSAFVIYFAGEHGLIERTGEITCDRIESQGKPRVEITNAKWDTEIASLVFDVRSNCGVVKFLGGEQGDALINLTSLEFKSALESPAYSESSRRLSVGFEKDGEFQTAAVLSPSAKGMKKCVAEAKSSKLFRVCGPDDNQAWVAYWQSDGQQIEEWVLDCGPNDSQERTSGVGYFIGACTNPVTKDGVATVSLSLAHQDAPRSIDIEIACKCGTLLARRLEFDMARREITFNLETDASKVSFDHQEFELPTIGVEKLSDRSRAAVPLIAIRLNDRWQIIEIVSIANEFPSSILGQPVKSSAPASQVVIPAN